MFSSHTAHGGDDDREKDQRSAKDKEETLEEVLDDGDEEIEDDQR